MLCEPAGKALLGTGWRAAPAWGLRSMGDTCAGADYLYPLQTFKLFLHSICPCPTQMTVLPRAHGLRRGLRRHTLGAGRWG